MLLFINLIKNILSTFYVKLKKFPNKLELLLLIFVKFVEILSLSAKPLPMNIKEIYFNK
jgi:hypothetical protein